MSDWNDEYKAKVRAFVAEHGTKVDVRGHDPRGLEDVSTYGWQDYDAYKHVYKGSGGDDCSWVVPEGAVMRERSYTEWGGTFGESTTEVGVNVYGCSCRCGKYSDVILRWDGSVTDMLHSILDLPVNMEVTL